MEIAKRKQSGFSREISYVSSPYIIMGLNYELSVPGFSLR